MLLILIYADIFIYFLTYRQSKNKNRCKGLKSYEDYKILGSFRSDYRLKILFGIFSSLVF